MPLNERQEYYDISNNIHKVEIIVFIIIAIVLLALYIIFKNEKNFPGYVFLMLLVLSLVIIFVGIRNINYDKKFVENNTLGMHYVTINGTGTVNYIETDDIYGNKNQKVRFDANGKNYFMTLDGKDIVASGDTVKVETDKKVPTQKIEGEKDLGYYVPDIKVSVKHNGKWKKLNVDKKRVLNGNAFSIFFDKD